MKGEEDRVLMHRDMDGQKASLTSREAGRQVFIGNVGKEYLKRENKNR